MKKINVLSLFGGIECGRVAMDRLGWEIGTYYSSEFDPYPRSQTEKNFPDIIHLGDVREVKYEDGKIHWNDGRYLQWSKTEIGILIGGSPCQDLSIAKAGGKGLEGEKSGLFFEYVRILKESKPKYFMLENVASMKKADKEEILRCLREVVPETEVHMINSALVSAQNRKRLYFTNIPGITQPEDRGIFLRDILEDIRMDDARWKPLDEKYVSKLKQNKNCMYETNSVGKLRQGYEMFKEDGKTYGLTVGHAGNTRIIKEKSSGQLVVGQFRRTDLRIHADQEKTCTLTANMGTGGNNVPVVLGAYNHFNQRLTTEKTGNLTTTSNFTGKSSTVILGLAHRNRGEGKKPECNGTEKANSLTTVQSDSEVFGCLELTPESPQFTAQGIEEMQNMWEETSVKYVWRKLTCLEAERLQTLPDNFTKDLSNSRRYKAIGNGWTVAVIEHILSFVQF